ncbi:MAG TPA: aldose 1-epimerase family protein [Spirochaetia bacterium]|nr:aldose 1-epimerase family protein [Spirochaetia bacterium]
MISSIKNDRVYIRVSSLGAELTSLKTVKDGFEYLWQPDPKFWARQAPTLFPLVGSVEDGRYRVGDEEYELGIHGFAKDTDFRLTDESSDSLTYVTESNPETLKSYPYRFTLQVRIKLEKDGVSTEYAVRNTDSRTIYFSIGGHPGFRCPWEEGLAMEDYALLFEKAETLERLLHDGGLRTGKTEPFLKGEKRVPLSHRLFDRGAVILEGFKSGHVVLGSDRSDRQVRFEFPGFPYLGIWSAKGEAPFVCIEPWFGIASARGGKKDLREKEGMNALDPGGTFECGYRIAVEDSTNV